MKRVITLLLAVVILCSLAVTVYADESGSTTIKTTVYSQPPSWTLSIPADITIPYMQTSTRIGAVEVKNISNPGGAPGYVDIMLTYENLQREYGYDQIPLMIKGVYTENYDFYMNPDQYDGSYPMYDWTTNQVFQYPYSYNGPNGSEPYHSAMLGPDYGNNAYPVMLYAEISNWNAPSGKYSTTLNFTSSMTYKSDENNW